MTGKFLHHFKVISFHNLPDHLISHFVRYNVTHPRLNGWKQFHMYGKLYIMNRQDRWYYSEYA